MCCREANAHYQCNTTSAISFSPACWEQGFSMRPSMFRLRRGTAIFWVAGVFSPRDYRAIDFLPSYSASIFSVAETTVMSPIPGTLVATVAIHFRAGCSAQLRCARPRRTVGVEHAALTPRCDGDAYVDSYGAGLPQSSEIGYLFCGPPLYTLLASPRIRSRLRSKTPSSVDSSGPVLEFSFVSIASSTRKATVRCRNPRSIRNVWTHRGCGWDWES